MANHNRTGEKGEQHVASTLRQVAPVTKDSPADLSFLGAHIEVKAATPTRYNGHGLGFQFCLRKAGHTSIDKAHVVVLVCLNEDETTRAVFVVPVAKFGTRRKLGIPLDLPAKHWLQPYRDAWEIIAQFTKEPL